MLTGIVFGSSRLESIRGMGYPPLAGLVFVPSVGWRFATNPGKMRPRFDVQVIGLHGGTVLFFFLCGEIWGLQ